MKLESVKGNEFVLRTPFLDKLEEALNKAEFSDYRDEVLNQAETRKTWDVRGKYVFAWLASRLDIVENICGINEEWPMFSPNAGRGDRVARARLQYADGTDRLIRQRSEPADLTHFSRWNEEKILDHETKVKWSRREDECWAYCNLLSYRYPENENRSPLRRILLYSVFIDYPKPGDPDPRGFLLRQMELIRDHNSEQALRTFYTFNLAEDRDRRQGTMAVMRKGDE